METLHSRLFSVGDGNLPDRNSRNLRKRLLEIVLDGSVPQSMVLFHLNFPLFWLNIQLILSRSIVRYSSFLFLFEQLVL